MGYSAPSQTKSGIAFISTSLVCKKNQNTLHYLIYEILDTISNKIPYIFVAY